jgi:hypothetical protein
MERPPINYFCNKCGHYGDKGGEHDGCDYLAFPSLEQQYIDHLTKQRDELVAAFKDALWDEQGWITKAANLLEGIDSAKGEEK